jgi:ABC-type nitrate/sulfonate/bicarbonate transport system substrate-binding protein
MLIAALLACTPEAPPPTEAPEGDPIRIGWQTTWATQGQIAVILEKTDILAKHGFAGELKGFSYGGPLNEGALAGEVDALFTADQPAISLYAKDPAWGVVARLMYNRVGLFVPPGSPAQSVADLRGGTVAVPFGASAHREAIKAIKAAGLDPKADVSLTNLGLGEIVALAGAGAEGGTWGGTSAAATWDPTFANLVHEGKARALHTATVTALVLLDDDYTKAHPGADLRLRDAVADAWSYFRDHKAEANAWFLEASKLTLDPAVLETCASVEPNYTSADPVRVTLSPEDVAGLQGVADFMLETGLLKAPVRAEAMLRAPAR